MNERRSTSSSNASSSPPPAAILQPRDYLILLGLAGGRCHGYGLIKEIAHMSDDGVRMDPANLHRALQRLVRDGLVRDLGRLPKAEERRRYYEITDRGMARARGEARRLERLSAVARARLAAGEPKGAS
ncbi:MAG: PadR family transcriptional regulator [Acidobacteriota bacterium]